MTWADIQKLGLMLTAGMLKKIKSKGETNGVKLEQVGVKGMMELFSTPFRNVSLNS